MDQKFSSCRPPVDDPLVYHISLSKAHKYLMHPLLHLSAKDLLQSSCIYFCLHAISGCIGFLRAGFMMVIIVGHARVTMQEYSWETGTGHCHLITESVKVLL